MCRFVEALFMTQVPDAAELDDIMVAQIENNAYLTSSENA